MAKITMRLSPTNTASVDLTYEGTFAECLEMYRAWKEEPSEVADQIGTGTFSTGTFKPIEDREPINDQLERVRADVYERTTGRKYR